MSESEAPETGVAGAMEQPPAPGELLVPDTGSRALLAVAAGALIGLLLALVALLPGMRIGRGRRWSMDKTLASWRYRGQPQKEQNGEPAQADGR